MVLYITSESPFISTHLLYYYIKIFKLRYYTIILNIILSITFYLSSGDIYLSLGISLSFSFVTVSELFCCEFFETFVILLAILLPIKSQVASTVF